MLRSLAQLTTLSVLFIAGCGDEGSAPPAPEPVQAEPTANEPPSGEERNDDAPVQPAPTLAPETAAALEAMGYLPSAPTDNPEDRGVTRNEPSAHPGVNLYSTRHRASASLITMDGRVLHAWEVPDADDSPTRWMHVEPLPNGDLLAITLGDSVTRHAWDSSVVWRRNIPAHHDLAIHEDGRLFVLVRWAEHHRFRPATIRGDELPVLADGITILTPDGERVRRVELLPLLEPHLDSSRLERLRARVEAGETAGLVRGGGLGDLLHTNSIEFLEHAIEGVAPVGSVLLSFRNLSRVAILSPDLSEVLWVWGRGELQGQHDATQLESGRLLIFDNGNRRHASRVIEVDPRTDEIGWTYQADDFYTELRGGAQRLPNGNTLITESDRGRSFEVTATGEIVWEFWNPDIRHVRGETERGVIYRLNRFDASVFPRLVAQGQTAATPSTPEG